MTELFKMDEVQPRLLDETGQGVIGTPMDRPEGKLKVTGRARYTAEHLRDGMVHGVLLRATVTRGRVTGFDAGRAKDLPGYLGLFHGPKFVALPAQGLSKDAPMQPGDRVLYHGQPIALVVAESFEVARDAAARIAITYDEEPGAPVNPDETPLEGKAEDDTVIGDLEAAMKDAAAAVDLDFATAGQVSAAMEPHAAIAEWDGDQLTMFGSVQMVQYNRAGLADALGIAPEKVRLLAPYVGGGFGSKLGISSEHVSAAIAARELGRPVRVVMTRQNVFDAVMRRTETAQRVRLAADKEGRLTAVGHEDRVSNIEGAGFREPVSAATRFLYAGPNRLMRQRSSINHRTPAGSVRAPGEAVGMLALECAMDELAEKLGLDPVELRLRNIPEVHPETGQPFTAHALAESLREGAAKFGWADRPGVGARREGEWRIGMGMASAARTNLLIPSEARVTLVAHGTGVRAVVETDMTDIGTGTYAIFTQITAEMLGLAPDQVEVRLADSDLPPSCGSGGSFGASSAGSAVYLAARKLREALIDRIGGSPNAVRFTDGGIEAAGTRHALADLLPQPLAMEAKIEKGKTAESHFSSGFGAHFAEVAVSDVSGEIRVRRMLGVFGIGRVLNEKTARSQAVGGMIWGVGAALHEELAHDPRTGHIVSRDLANYHVPAHADIPRDLQVVFLPERDDQANPMQSKGVGELGISGAGAAVLNAVHNATGIRLHDFPATPDKVISAMIGA